MASSKPEPKKARPRKAQWADYTPSKRFEFWAMPITEASYNQITAADVLEYLRTHKLADKILPIVEKGIQPIGPHGPSASFRTETREYESASAEYQQIKRALFGQPDPKPVKPEVSKEPYSVKKEMPS